MPPICARYLATGLILDYAAVGEVIHRTHKDDRVRHRFEEVSASRGRPLPVGRLPDVPVDIRLVSARLAHVRRLSGRALGEGEGQGRGQ